MGVGASAGGLEALEALLRPVPPKSGLAFIVIQHLDPTHRALLVELLQRATALKVLQAKERMKVEADCVYVIPPNKDISVRNGVLHLHEPLAPRGLRLPIDFFFRSLALDQHTRSIAVVLSGMGSDGTLGVADIKEKGGAVFVQTPASAKFDAMPRSVIDAGFADVVAPAEELTAGILAYRKRFFHSSDADPVLVPATQSAIEKICALLLKQTGHDFSQYKRSTIYRRIERRMGLHGVTGIANYARRLEENQQEATLLFKELLIGVTSFFRDPAAWDQLAKSIHTLLAQHPVGGTLRAWVAGCSTGQEAYSLAILFQEVVAGLPLHRPFTLQIFATDLDKDAIDRARTGSYPLNIARDVSSERLSRFFAEEEHGYRVRQEIREMVIFATQDVIRDPPFTKLDLLICRNLLIYLEPELQKTLLPLFHYSLNPGGFLFLGSAESPGAAAGIFTAEPGRVRIFRRLETLRSPPVVEFPASFPARMLATAAPPGKRVAPPNLQLLTERLLLERYSPAAVLTNDAGDILYISGRTGRYLEPASGKANWNVHAMANEGLQHELISAFSKALRSGRKTVRARVQLQDGPVLRLVDVTVEPLHDPAPLRGLVLVVFGETTVPVPARPLDKPPRTQAAIGRMTQQLRLAREDVRNTREEMQSSQEELKSANEELQSTNEELQSTNEELTTSKEEMQSLNEELQTVNHELQAKLDELSYANDDMRNLLDSTDIATLFLDGELHVRRFTAQMTKIIKLIPSDVDRPITDLASGLVYADLAADARAVLKTLVFKETQVRTTDGRWFSVRIMPYRTLDNRINGVVITFIDISTAKRLEETLRQTGEPVGPTGSRHS